MKTKLISDTPEAVEADALAIVLFEATGGEANPAGGMDALTDGLIAELYESKEFTGKLLRAALIHRPGGLKAGRLLLVGGGKREEFTPARLRQAAGVAVRELKSKGVKLLAFLPAGAFDAGEQIQAIAEGAILALYEPDAYKTEDKSTDGLEELVVLADPKRQDWMERGRIIAEAQNFARGLINEPGNRLPPTALGARAAEMGAAAGLDVEVLQRDRLAELNMGALLGVAQGSAEPPVLIVVRYRPAKSGASGVHLGLVGKAVTFDTGGISIKPAQDMDKMKYDMAGGAAMLGAMRALAALKPKVAVTAVIPSVENMPGQQAQRPGDVVTTMSGKTVEVLNTDAEGRLILADALTYAKQQGCTHLVDAATLTGAIAVALGHERAGLFANNDAWRDRVLASAAASGEKLWPMPLDEEYKEQLKSLIADLPNIGNRWGGAVTAAMFLKQFADPTPWVHLDIAGTAWIEEAKPYLPKGPSGIGVRTFVDLAMKMSER
jgi:leucyl aminopeptidase